MEENSLRKKVEKFISGRVDSTYRGLKTGT